MRPTIAVTSGEPAGIGPELCLQLATVPGEVRLVILGDRELLAERAKLLGLNIVFRDFCAKSGVDRSTQELPGCATLDVLHVPSYRRMVWPKPCALVATIHDLAPFRLPGKYDALRMLYGRVVVRQLAHRQDEIVAVSRETAADITHAQIHLAGGVGKYTITE